MTDRERLEKAVDRLQHERTAFLSRFERLDQAQLDFKPYRNSWSIGQIAHHVALGESVWQGYLKNVLAKGDREDGAVEHVSLKQIPFRSRFLPDFIFKSPLVLPMSVFVNMLPRPLQSTMFAIPLFKMDASDRMQPTFGLPRARVLNLLEQTRKRTLELVEPRADWDLARFRVVHPLVGSQDIYGVLDLLASHEQRHSIQVDSIRRKSAFPGRKDKAGTV